MMLSAGSIGTEVNSEVTSYDDRHSCGCRVNILALVTKSPVLCMWWEDLPTNSLSALLRTLDTPYVTEPLLENIGLRGLPVLWILGNP